MEIESTKFQGTGKLLAGMMCGIVLTAVSSFGEDLSKAARNKTDQQPNDEHVAPAGVASSNQHEFQDAVGSWDKFMDEHAEDIPDIEEEQLALLHRIALARVKNEGVEAFHSISESLHDDDVRFGVLGHLLEEMVQSDPQLAFDAAIGLDRDEGRTLVWDVVLNWSASDAKSALDHSTSADIEDDLRLQLQEAVIRSWAARTPDAILGNVEQLPEELRIFGRQEALSSLARSAPETAALQIGSVRDIESRRITATAIARSWLRRDVSEAIGWVQTSPELDEIRRDVLVEVLQDLAERNPTLAFDTALQHPIQDSEVGLEASVIARVASSDVDEALNLLQEVRSGPTKTAACTSIGSTLARNGELARAMSLIRQLPESSQDFYTGTVVVTWSMTNPTKVTEQIDQLPSDELKAQAALMALSANHEQKKLSKDQVETLKTYMSEQMLELFEQMRHTMSISP